jgi:hypothetical protein
MIVKPADDVWSYTVTSQSGVQDYDVDLVANNGAGQCSCESWQYRSSPMIAKGERHRCKHVTAAMFQLAEDLVTRQVQRLGELESAAAITINSGPYQLLVKQFKDANPVCGVCNSARTCDVHHSRGRLGELLTMVMYWVPVCRVCHDWIHNNPAVAREKSWRGISLLAPKGQFNTLPLT